MLGWDGTLPLPSVRTIEEMRSVLADPSCEANAPLYFMYRDLAKSEVDKQWLSSHKLRYDLTVIPPCTLCGEWVKTKGHYHPKNPAGTGYPEVYEVLDGEAKYLLQSRRLDDVVMISAHAGDIIVIPPEYGHISINPSADKVLAMANIVSTAFESEYGEYETLHGAAYYAMSDGRLRKNPHYPKIPEVRSPGTHWRSTIHRLCQGPIYKLIGNESVLGFLNNPEKHPAVFAELLKD
jgi:glucose-6-phosphate isomerase